GSIATYGVKSVLETRNSSESPEMYYQVGRYAQEQGRFDAATQAYEHALKLKSHYPEASNALATVYALQGKYDLAAQRLGQAVKENPRAAYLHNNLGYVLYLKGDYTQAITFLEQAVALDPRYARAHTNLALAYTKTGNAQLAGEHHARALQLARLPDAAVPQTASRTAAASPRNAPSTAGSIAGPVMHPPEQKSSTSYRDVAPAAVGAVASSPALSLVRVAPGIYELRAPETAVRPTQAQRVADMQSAATISSTNLRPFRLEVSNGNGATGMAKRVAHRLREAGMTPVRLTNQKPWQRITEIQYGAGYAMEAAQLAALLRHQAMMIRSDKLRSDIKVRLVLGRDVRDETALLAPPAGDDRPRLARSN
ncbi:MAG: tetratricopeptide repeat protein, partial [Rhodospirillaceae bacterium]